ncbi:RagB/SusD family nutrient uptake outer membrane protein [Dyadobacter fanqingshengii]|uniref:RagB/SusD family nutrient uptake outer membrane protein n=1 Tax=Dyadobacter fanqingshengii TaxID=2906443 RepID=A0A9X1P6V5_9BACT|nr:RagB/SusD family nutrient uptake outer membrane protein [Dyadobacter fanqingshengii]MCF0039431.1 RagB/SusD family nutrient uptake outer membrane protein [Dyadobacter fanqingshengii]MCF2503027.1 RagB/SusD family nutrient uptake outer membrane protein [Dyadobacter fanqingshengii]USJ33758.1 RagB/SusD family nutrient uptake outer membrane protein [Dyadobacter fanqingshengii]
MKNQISKKGGLALLLVIMLIGYSCKETFLDIPATGQLDEAQLSTKKGIEGVLVSVYGQLNGRANRMASASNWVWGSIRGGDANKGTDPGDFSDINPIQRFEYQTTQGVILDKWKGNYEGVARANLVIKLLGVAQADVTEDDKKRIGGEARFLRAHYYFELKRGFNNVPFVDETKDYGTGIEAVPNTVELWPLIEADMKNAYESLPETQTAAGRANKWAAAAYLAKIYMYQKKFTEAKALYDLIIANGKTTNGKKFGLVPKFQDAFKASNDNNSESVFAIQAAANTGSVNNANPEFDLNWPYNTGPNGPGNCCSFFQPSFELGNSFRTDAAGLPLLDGSYNAAGKELKTDMGLKSSDPFTPDAGPVDPRLDHSIGRRGLPFLDWIDHPGNDWIRNQPNAGPYTPKKYAYYKSDIGSLQDNSSWTPGYTAINVNIIRYADVLLMAAEAEIEVGSLEKAREYVNLVRTRAANPESFVKRANGAAAANYVISTYKTAFASKDAARTAVRFERKLELSGEGHRFFDLVRWEIADSAINAYLTYEGKKLSGALGGTKFTVKKNEFLPVPQEQVDLLGKDVLVQNPGY